MRVRTMATMGLVALALGGCDKGEGKDAKQADATAKTAPTDAKPSADGKTEAADGGKEAADGGEDAPEDSLDERVVKAAGLAKKIEADPVRADEILAEAGLDRVSFDALIFEVSTPELAEQYRLARSREEG